VSRPVLVLGRSDVPALLQAEMGWDDDDVPYGLGATSDRVAPAGDGGEFVAFALLVTTRRFGPAQFTVRYAIDGTWRAPVLVTLAGASAAQGTIDLTELTMYEPFHLDGVEVLRQAARGTWIEVEVRTDGAVYPPAGFEVSSVEVELEIVRESRKAVGG
jgi:hypothetical protein